MDDLGNVFLPEQYAPAGNDCLISNSALAYDFFADNLSKSYLSPEGGVVLILVPYKAIKPVHILLWAYVVKDTGKFVSVFPAFQLKNCDVDLLNFTAFQVIEKECYFKRDNKLYAIINTDKKYTIIQKVCSILTLKDAIALAEFNTGFMSDDAYPCKVYALDDGRFLATCWALYYRNTNTSIYLTVSLKDTKYLKGIDASDTTSYPITVGEDTIINGGIYKLCTDGFLGQFFHSQKKKATPLMWQKENLILPKSRLPYQKNVRLKEIYCGKNEEKPGTASIINMNK